MHIHKSGRYLAKSVSYLYIRGKYTNTAFVSVFDTFGTPYWRGQKIAALTQSARDFDHTHIFFEPRPFSHQRDCVTSEARGFLAVERAVSQVEHTI